MFKQQSKKEIKTLIIFFSLSLLLIGFDKLGWLNFIKRPVETASNFVRGKTRYFWQNFQFQAQKNSVAEQQKLEFLEIENAELKVKIHTLEQENTAMKKLLGAPLPPSWKFIPCQVLGIEKGIMTINKGFDSKVKEGQVVVFKNILIGRVIKANPQLAKVALPTSKSVQIKSKVFETGAEGIVVAKAEEKLVLAKILQKAEIKKDQIVITSGAEGIFPSNLLVAKIAEIKKEKAAVYQEAILVPIVNYEKLDNVFVVLN